MYEDSRNNRILFKNGISLMSEDALAEYMLDHDEIPEQVRIPKGDSSEVYSELYGREFGVDLDLIEDDLGNSPEYLEKVTKEFKRSTDGVKKNISDLYTLLEENINHKRLDDLFYSNEQDLVDERMRFEVQYFSNHGHCDTILTLTGLIKQFKEKGVVWGVGRGSACASLVLYLLEVHDVDPLKYDIPFSEMTKESNSDY